MKILGLDIATSTGWAVEGKKCGVINLKEHKDDGLPLRSLHLKTFIKKMNKEYGPFDLIAYERKDFSTNTYNDQILFGLVSVVTLWSEENNIPCEGFPVGTVKKHATGKGTASKDAMILAAELLGYVPPNDDAADAAMVYECAKAKYDGGKSS